MPKVESSLFKDSNLPAILQFRRIHLADSALESTIPSPSNSLDSFRKNGATDFALHFHFFDATDATKFKSGESPLPPQYSSKLTRFVKGKDLDRKSVV